MSDDQKDNVVVQLPFMEGRKDEPTSVEENHQNTEQTGILPRLALIFGDGMTGLQIADQFTCDEAETIATFLALVMGQPEKAASWLMAHSYGDKDEDDVHHGLREEDALAWVLTP